MPTTLQARYRQLSHRLCYSPDLTSQGADLMVRLDAAANELEPPMTLPVRAAYHAAYAAHAAAQRTISESLNPTDRMIRAEQDAYDALVDFVDAHFLTWSIHDPRGTRQEHEQTR